MNDTSPHDTCGCAASANTVRGRSGNAEGPSGLHYIIGPLQKASGPRKKEKTAMSHFWDTHHKKKNAVWYRLSHEEGLLPLSGLSSRTSRFGRWRVVAGSGAAETSH